MMRHSRMTIILGVVLITTALLFPALLDAKEANSFTIRFSRSPNESAKPFKLYILHQGLPTALTAPMDDGSWPVLQLYPGDTVTLISNREIPSCTNRVVRIDKDINGISWENPHHGVIGCDKIDWIPNGDIIVTDDF